jgi:prolipoprotein diacylglyceryltransferase
VLATLKLDFDPSTSIFGLSMRWETLALAGVAFLVLLLGAIGAGRSGAGAAAADDEARGLLPRLRRDDLILVAFGAVPGAVVGGRLDYVLAHLDYYQANQSAITDPSQGGFGLTLAVVLGTITAAAVARLLAAPVGRWLGVAAVPVLLGLGLGKLAMALGGEGQGHYSTASWATSYVHAGDWGSINPTFPAIPSQLFEGGLLLGAVVLMVAPLSLVRFRVRRWKAIIRPGFANRHDWHYMTGWRRYVVALGLWAIAHFAVASTWRDAKVWQTLNVEQIIVLAVVVATLVVLAVPIVFRGIHRGLVAIARRIAAARVTRAAEAAAAAEAAETARVAAMAEAARKAEEAEAVRVAAEAEAEAARKVAEEEAARLAAGLEAAREAARVAAREAAARQAEQEEAARVAAEADAARVAAEVAAVAEAEAKTQLKQGSATG